MTNWARSGLNLARTEKCSELVPVRTTALSSLALGVMSKINELKIHKWTGCTASAICWTWPCSNMNVRSHKCTSTGTVEHKHVSAEANNLSYITTLSKTSSLPHKNRFHGLEDRSSCVLYEEQPLLSLSGRTENASDLKRVWPVVICYVIYCEKFIPQHKIVHWSC